ncbi:MAG: hydroxymethylglutaryl-CoA reductase [Candidatus Omnitrophota bacterium]
MEELKKKNIPYLSKADLIPRDKNRKNNLESIKERHEWLQSRVNNKFPCISNYSFSSKNLEGNIENLCGAGQIPLGITGPILLNGDHAKGKFYVPFATTEGALVEGYERGMIAMTRAGGANAKVHSEKMHITPVFILRNLNDACKMEEWIRYNFLKIKKIAEQSTAHGKLLELKSYIIGRRIFITFIYYTADAMGLNMINVATDAACEYISKQIVTTGHFLRSNLSSDKKASLLTFINGYSKEVSVDCVLPRSVISRYLRSSAERMYEFWYCSVLGSLQAGAIGLNAHYANALAAIFIACGQDVAQITNAALGISMCEVTKEKDLYIALRLPCLVVGTVGGGTSLPTQQECLKIMECYGSGMSNKFAEIVAATLLAGEVSICAAIASGDFINRHKVKHEYLKKQIGM